MTAQLHLPSESDVAAARTHIAGTARRTPLWRLDADTLGINIWLKLENLQPLGSFKIRAAVNAIKSADAQSLHAGILSPSAGNFGLGLAWAARDLGVPVTIIAPDSAAMAKTARLEALGARVIRVPFAEWWQVLQTRRFKDVGGAFFHPVAGNAVIAGNATVGAEILEELPAFDTVIVPFGGGGLISGIGSVMRRTRPGTRMIAVESETAQPVAAALSAGKPTPVSHASSFVDGIGSSEVLKEMWPLVRETVDQAICVSLAEIADAVRLLAIKHKIVAEGAGAASVAAALSGRAGKGNIVCIVSGGNIDALKLATILNGEVPK